MVDFAKYTKRTPRLDLNPSAAERWTSCTASPAFILENADKIPPDDTQFSTEGTTAHEVATALLEDRKPNEESSYFCPVPVTPEMHRHAWNFMEYVTALAEPGAKIYTEQKLPLWYAPERNAKVDVDIVNSGSLHIVDYKYGEGIIVDPQDNLQLAIYARASMEKHLPEIVLDDPPQYNFPIHLHIYQPRGRDADEPHRVWHSTWGEIYSLTEETVTPAAGLILHGKLYVNVSPDGTLTEKSPVVVFAPSADACRFCPAKGFCSARQETITRDIDTLAVINNGPKHFTPAKAISVAQLAAIIKHKSEIEKWLKDAYAYALAHLSTGGKIPGVKLATSRGGNRYWTNPKAAAKLLLQTHLRKEEVIQENVIGPAGAEKLLGKRHFGAELMNLIARPPGKPVIVSEDDPRANLMEEGENDFTALDDEPE